MKITVDHTWIATDKHTFDAGVHEIDKPTKALLKAVAIGQHAGVVTKVEASRDEHAAMKGHVQSDEDALKALAKAQEEGGWYEGNARQYLNDVERGGREHFGPQIDVDTYVAERKGRSSV